MKVTVLENTHDRLVVRCSPWWGWWTWFTRVLALVIALSALLVLVGSLDRVTLECDRSREQCALMRTALAGSERHEFMPADLRGAHLQAEDEDGSSGRAMLLVEDREILFTHYAGGEESELNTAVQRINAFAGDPTLPRLKIGFNHLLTGLMLGLILSALAVAVAWWGRVTTCDFNCTTNTVQLRRSVLIPIIHTRTLDSISDVDVRTVGRLINRQRQKQYEVRLLFTGGRQFAIDSSTDRGIASQLASTIRRFLGL